MIGNGLSNNLKHGVIIGSMDESVSNVMLVELLPGDPFLQTILALGT